MVLTRSSNSLHWCFFCLSMAEIHRKQTANPRAPLNEMRAVVPVRSACPWSDSFSWSWPACLDTLLLASQFAHRSALPGDAVAARVPANDLLTNSHAVR